MLHSFDWLARWATYRPDKVAFKEFETGRSLTFAQLNRLGNHLAHHLQSQMGFDKGSRIAIIAENCLEYWILFTAMQKTGGILAPLNYRLAGAELDYLLSDCDPQILICEDKFSPKLEGSAQRDKIPFVLSVSELSDMCSSEQEETAVEPYTEVSIQEEDPILILYTSGTTGFPKGALYTHKMLFWNSINTALSLIVNTESRTINCMPPFHTGGWNVLSTPFLHHGGYSCLVKSFDAAVILQLLEEERATIFMGVPTMLKRMAEQPEFASCDFKSLHYMVVGGEPMPLPLIRQWHQRGVPIRQGYGMTEVGPNLTSLHQQDAVTKIGSIGRANFYVDTRIVDEAGHDCAPGKAGELLLKGPMVTPGYWNKPAATSEALTDGWFKTGDRVLQDEEGYLFVVDRIKNMFISGGENIYPAEVERVIQSHPAVNEVAVIGVPDPKWGETGKAFIVSKTPLQITAIQDYCCRRLAKFKIPKYVVFMDELPKNDTGKIDREMLAGLSQEDA